MRVWCQFLLIPRHKSFHGRERKLKIRPSVAGARYRDSLVLLRNGQIVQVISHQEPWEAIPVNLEPFTPNIEIDLPWSLVGVHTYAGLDYDQTVYVRREEVIGKAMICGDLICTLLSPWFMSKADD